MFFSVNDDIDKSSSSTSDYEEEMDESYCCGEKMIQSLDYLTCNICNNIMFKSKNVSEYSTNHNTGQGSNSSLITFTIHNGVKIYKAYQPHSADKDNIIKDEFKRLSGDGEYVDVECINKSIYLYKQILTNYGIKNKGKIKEDIQLACIFITKENNGVPASKKEFCSKLNIDEKKLTIGYKKLRELDGIRDDFLIIKYKNIHDNIPGFINRLIQTEDKNFNMFIKNLVKLITGNPELHQNKHPEGLSVSIVNYTCEKFKIQKDIDYMVKILYVSKKNVMEYYKFLKKIEEDEFNKFYPYIQQIITAFCV